MKSAIKKDAGIEVAHRVLTLVTAHQGNPTYAKNAWAYADGLIDKISQPDSNWLDKTTHDVQQNWRVRFDERFKSDKDFDALVRKCGHINVLITIQKDGAVSEAVITQSSSNVAIDDLAKQACLDTHVNPPPPDLQIPVQMQLTFTVRVPDRSKKN